jgi:hypothetical protein
LPLYDPNPEHLWNRLFAAFYLRPSELPSRPKYPDDPTQLDSWDRKLRSGELPLGPVVNRIEGGDVLAFLAWQKTRYYSQPATFQRADRLLDEFLEARGERLIDDPLRPFSGAARLRSQAKLPPARPADRTERVGGDRPGAGCCSTG